MLMNADSL